jgi:hypothetical protein
MSVAEILKALSRLDVENDEHWTENGAPRLDVVQKLMPGVTREMLVRAAPKFSRRHPEVPDLEAMRQQAQERMAELQRAVAEAKEAEEEGRKDLERIESLHRQVHDSHALTRANQTWIAAQNAVGMQRMERAKLIDALVADAGGAKNIGRHPIEVNTALRIKAARKEANKNFVAKG